MIGPLIVCLTPEDNVVRPVRSINMRRRTPLQRRKNFLPHVRPESCVLETTRAKPIAIMTEQRNTSLKMPLKVRLVGAAAAEHLVHAEDNDRNRESALRGEGEVLEGGDETMDARVVVVVGNELGYAGGVGGYGGRGRRGGGGYAAEVSGGEGEDGVEEHGACHGEVRDGDGEVMPWVVDIQLKGPGERPAS
jgi:hypothetical protein